jgi:hypothetical protein
MSVCYRMTNVRVLLYDPTEQHIAQLVVKMAAC